MFENYTLLDALSEYLLTKKAPSEINKLKKHEKHLLNLFLKMDCSLGVGTLSEGKVFRKYLNNYMRQTYEMTQEYWSFFFQMILLTSITFLFFTFVLPTSYTGHLCLAQLLIILMTSLFYRTLILRFQKNLFNWNYSLLSLLLVTKSSLSYQELVAKAELHKIMTIKETRKFADNLWKILNSLKIEGNSIYDEIEFLLSLVNEFFCQRAKGIFRLMIPIKMIIILFCFLFPYMVYYLKAVANSLSV